MADDRSSFEQRIKQKLADADVLRRCSANQTLKRMEQIDHRSHQFNEAASRVMRDIIRPRMEILTSQFDNATLTDSDEQQNLRCVCVFGRTARYPAETRLDIGIGHDGEIENLLLSYNLQILPVFIRFDRHDEMACPLDEVDDNRFAAWVENKIEQFVDTYLSLEHSPQYQRENLVTDPVCGMTINKTVATSQAKHQGKAHYFCTEDCHRAFVEHPERYIAALAT